MGAIPIRRRVFVVGAAASTLCARTAVQAQARADTYRIICGFPPGGPVDLICRKLAERMAAITGANAFVENKVGAAGRLAVAELVKAPADGSAMLVTAASIITMYPHLYKQLTYDIFTDLTPVGTVASTAFAFAAGPAVPDSATTVTEVVRWSQAKGAAIACGNSGAGSMQHFLASMISRETGIEINHVPYRGGAASMQALAGGEVPLAVGTESAARALAQAGKLRVLATTGAQRSALYSQAPTFAELGWPALSQREWFGVLMPARVPMPTVEKTAALLAAIVGSPEVRETWDKQSLSVDNMHPAALKAAIQREYDFWAPIIRSSGFTPEA